MPEQRIPHDPPVALEVDGQAAVCPHAAAEWWMRRLAAANWYGIAVGAAPHLADRIGDALDAFDLDDAARIAIALTETVTGMSWPRAVRLAATVGANWPAFEAWAATHAAGLDLLNVPPRRTLAAAYAMLLAQCEKEAEAEAMNRRLDDPNNVPGITHGERRRAFTMSAEEIAAMQQGAPALKGGA
ncbi:hypothetical protein ACIRLA_46410 [Streptomyces sp. NPDC102364]|uniref:hypothetical protein n=1 Tax=Streptomyces sp. NPDC102364 TaxID=3366161 RepID=UPI003820CD4C